MPNWCSTRYRLTGEGAVKLNNLIEENKRSEKENWDWLGHIVRQLGGDEGKLYCRGWISDYELKDDELTIYCETAWGELNEWREFVNEKLDTHIYYIAEEPGNEVYVTNEPDFEYWYQVDYADGVDGNCGTIVELKTAREVLELVSKVCGVEVSYDDEEQYMKIAETLADKFNEDNADGENYIYVHEYEFEDD